MVLINLFLQIQQLEDMIQRQVSVDSSSENEASMTFQFTKIAAVFASLAQRVVKSQKQAKNSEVSDKFIRFSNKKKAEKVYLQQDVFSSKTSTFAQIIV